MSERATTRGDGEGTSASCTSAGVAASSSCAGAESVLASTGCTAWKPLNCAYNPPRCHHFNYSMSRSEVRTSASANVPSGAAYWLESAKLGSCCTCARPVSAIRHGVHRSLGWLFGSNPSLAGQRTSTLAAVGADARRRNRSPVPEAAAA